MNEKDESQVKKNCHKFLYFYFFKLNYSESEWMDSIQVATD